MTATQGQLAALSRFVFRAPRWYRSLAFAVLLAGLTGIAVFDAGATMQARFGLLLVGQDAWQGIVFIGVPTVVAAVATTAVDRAMGGQLTYNRSSLLALVSEVVVVVFVLAAAIAVAAFGLDQRLVFDALVIGLASVFALRLFVVLSVSRLSIPQACLPASIQSGVAAVLLFVYSGTAQYLAEGGSARDAYVAWLARGEAGPPALAGLRPVHFLLLVALSGVYAVAVWAFLAGIDRPWRRSLGVSVLDFVRGYVGHVAEGSRDLERFFETLGQSAVVPVSVVSFRRLENGEPGPETARIVLPGVHPGPMGEIGGGDLPARIASDAEGLAFPPHAAAGHDFNLVSEREIDRVLAAADRALEAVEYGREASVPVRERAGDATMLAQGFGDAALGVATFAPGSADDVDFAVGQSAAAELRAAGLREGLVVDAHNCHTGVGGPESGQITPGSPRAYDLRAVCSLAGRAIVDAPRGELELGVAHDPTDWTPAEGIGPLGVRVAVTRVAGRETVAVLIDGNNVIPGLRERLLAAIEEATGIEHAEVLTTDTHAVNLTRADNRVGAEIDGEELCTTAVDLVRTAREDLEPVAVGAATQRVEVTVFGNDRTETLAAQANAAVSLGGALLAAVVALATVVSLLLLLLA